MDTTAYLTAGAPVGQLVELWSSVVKVVCSNPHLGPPFFLHVSVSNVMSSHPLRWDGMFPAPYISTPIR